MILPILIWWILIALLAVSAIVALIASNVLVKIVSVILFVVLVWSFLVEKNLIVTEKLSYTAPQLAGKKIVFISDLHVGVYKSDTFYKRLAFKINQLEPDLVLIAGDFVYYPQNIKKQLEFFSKISAPKVAVFGNHDLLFKQKLSSVLQDYGIVILENSSADFNGVKIYGLSELWEGKTNPGIAPNNSSFKIVIAHNPDAFLARTFTSSLLLAGHTHCGQIRMPFLYEKIIPTKGDFAKKGWNKAGENSVFISCGIGEVGLPLRLLNPPTVYLIEFSA